MNKNKLGFTLSEVLVSVAVIGVIMALSVNTLKIVRASYTSLGFFAHKNVVNMVGVLNAGNTGNDALTDNDGKAIPSVVTQCKTDDGAYVRVFKTDNEKFSDFGIPFCSQRNQITANVGENLFCKSLVAISNTSGATYCGNGELYTTGFGINPNSTSPYKEPYISDLIYESPTFITTNGQRFYLSEWTYNTEVSKDYGYRLIAVDINSKSRPNKTDRDDTKQPPDIITFLILDNGEVFPLGVAADNIKLANGRTIQYINSKVKGYYYNYDENRTTNIAPECTSTYNGKKLNNCNYAVVNVQNAQGNSFFSYREAYCTALGGKESVYKNYCDGITGSEYCPPSTSAQKFDLCTNTNVKPMFRYNFN